MRLLGWTSREALVVMTAREAVAVFDRARKFDFEAGGRFDVRNGRTIVPWSEDEHPDGGRGELIASMLFRWDTPDDAHATLVRIAWAEGVGTSEADVWRALDVLRGRG